MKSQTITGRTRLIALLGNPVDHSLSPAIHNHALATLDLPYAYVALPTPPQEVHTAMAALRACGFKGANVTIPHKQAVIPWCDHISELSRKIGAVNTLYFRKGLLHGTSTDAFGFFRALTSRGVDPADKDIVILGNGGTARTLAYGLWLESAPKSLSLVGRNQARVRSLAQEVSRECSHETRWATFDSPQAASLFENCALLINCTSVGMNSSLDRTPVDASFLHEGMVVFDAIYNPAETRLLREARQKGCLVENGLRMLLYQGLSSFEFWTGVSVPDDIFDLGELRQLIASPTDTH